MSLKVGFIGCGKIAGYHADALTSLGVEIVSVAYKNNLLNAQLFANKYSVKSIYNNYIDLIKANEYDFLWVIPTWFEMEKVIPFVLASGKPAFFEKPIMLSSSNYREILDTFKDIDYNKYLIGYNRRFYSNINVLKRELDLNQIVAISGELPEPVDINDSLLRKNRLIQNASHFYDTLFYLLGDWNYNIDYLRKIANSRGGSDHFISLSVKNIPINIVSVWNSPQNYTLKFYTESGKMFVLSPFEELSVIEGFIVKEPSKDIPIRKYIPNVTDSYIEGNSGFKPGFLEQAKYFIDVCVKGKSTGLAHSFSDTYKLIEFLEILKGTN